MDFKIDENGLMTSCLGSDVTVRIPDGVKKIACSAFREAEEAYGKTWYKPNKTMETVIIPASCEVIGIGAFQYCKALRCVRIEGNGLRKIDDCGFSICESLEEVELPEGILEIGEDAFSNCPMLKRIILPKSVKVLGNGLFTCSGVERIYYRGSEADFASIEKEYALDPDKLVYDCTLALGELPDR